MRNPLKGIACCLLAASLPLAAQNVAVNACLHPFIRNAVGSMEFGGCFLNKRLNRENNGGSIRRTTDVFQLATAVLFQNPIQNFALAPNNLTDAPQVCIDFLKEVPTVWDETGRCCAGKKVRKRLFPLI